MAAVAISRTELRVSDSRAAAKRLMDGRQSQEVLAIAMVLDGYGREAAAQTAAWTGRRCVTAFTAATRRVWMGYRTPRAVAVPPA